MSGLVTLKKDASARFPVRLVDTGGNPVTGVLATAVTASIERADGTTAHLTVTGNWTEVTAGAFSGQGNYDLTLPASATSVEGFLRLVVTATGAKTTSYVAQVAAYLSSDLYTEVGTRSTPADITAAETAILAAIAALPGAAAVASAVWDAVLSSHLVAGTAGRALYYTRLLLAQIEGGVRGGPSAH